HRTEHSGRIEDVELVVVVAHSFTLQYQLVADGTRSVPTTLGLVCVVTAGTSDMAVAEEVRETADWMGAGTDLIVDVGVAGP
ncbi:hypothetical protein NL533_34775, partial [Klebsiella pneumoniae]|nr:hypothetical protein [Klebsiella pneumoniae]